MKLYRNSSANEKVQYGDTTIMGLFSQYTAQKWMRNCHGLIFAPCGVLGTVTCKDLWMPLSKLKLNSLIWCPKHPTHSCLSVPIFVLGAHFQIEIPWMPAPLPPLYPPQTEYMIIASWLFDQSALEGRRWIAGLPRVLPIKFPATHFRLDQAWRTGHVRAPS